MLIEDGPCGLEVAQIYVRESEALRQVVIEHTVQDDDLMAVLRQRLHKLATQKSSSTGH